MKNNIKSMYVVCLVACAMALLNINYSDLAALDVVVIVVVIIAVLSIIYNYFASRKK
jgi:hypothetical protein